MSGTFAKDEQHSLSFIHMTLLNSTQMKSRGKVTPTCHGKSVTDFHLFHGLNLGMYLLVEFVSLSLYVCLPFSLPVSGLHLPSTILNHIEHQTVLSLLLFLLLTLSTS